MSDKNVIMIVNCYVNRKLDLSDVEELLPGVIHRLVDGTTRILDDKIKELLDDIPDQPNYAEVIGRTSRYLHDLVRSLEETIKQTNLLPEMHRLAKDYYVEEVNVKNNEELIILWTLG